MKIVISLGGSVIVPDKIDVNFLEKFKKIINKIKKGNKIVIVTGGGSGLGKAMTKYFLQLGAKVVITSRNLEKLQATAKELEDETGGKVLCVACDVRNWDEVEAMKDAAIKEFGFKKYYNTAKGQQFFYSIPTGGPLYQYFRKMVYQQPKRQWMEEAMSISSSPSRVRKNSSSLSCLCQTNAPFIFESLT